MTDACYDTGSAEGITTEVKDFLMVDRSVIARESVSIRGPSVGTPGCMNKFEFLPPTTPTGVAGSSTNFVALLSAHAVNPLLLIPWSFGFALVATLLLRCRIFETFVAGFATVPTFHRRTRVSHRYRGSTETRYDHSNCFLHS
jgi:hypothetical protein